MKIIQSVPNICIITDRHLSTNPRVWKEAQVLSRSGYSVTIVTQFNSKELVTSNKELLQQLELSVKYYSAVDISVTGSGFSTLYYKIRARLAHIFKKAGLDSVYLLNHVPPKIYHVALRENADLPNDTTGWGTTLQQLLDIQINKQYVIEMYNRVFGWETQEQKILTLVDNAHAK